MVEVIELTEENADDYASYLGADEAENIGRFYHRGIVVHDDPSWTPAAGMIWEISNAKDPAKATESRIVWIRIDHEETTGALFAAYEERIRREGVKCSSFSFPVEGHEGERISCEAAGFAVSRQEGDTIIVSLRELMEMTVFQNGAVPASISGLGDLPVHRFRSAISRFALMGRCGLCEDLEYLPMSYFDMDVSCYYEKDGRIDGLLLLHLMPSGRLAIKLLSAFGEDYAKMLRQMITWSVRTAAPILNPVTQIIIERHSDTAQQLTEKLFPKGAGIPIYRGIRQEG